ncbi:dihydrodipicolinate synthase family protein [Roseisalinus antarcticus]|uniref:4-hydroxy-tetrahydrodipicolinate synthase n=1 Tax=Roseisalinus antarcticus TaxID=254357 RepID=A0A1Y5RXF3_9RHOB|nr:dihydrodipicolinate synthase family protein [Roseisalinus antarcticus]SLN26670.1 4-hydroxy-tetrahydrodipicolinate synthase [Roseisalinus antarcticus]
MSDKADLKGVVCAAVTPVDAAFRIDAARLAHHCDRVLSDGCTFVSVFGTTGEGASFSSAEKAEALSQLIASGIPAARQIPAIMTPVLSEAAEMLAAIEAQDCRAALVLPPFYYADPGDEAIVAFIDAMLERSASDRTDLVLYNIPRFARIAYTPALVEKLLHRFGNRIVGVKDSTGALENGLTLAREFPGLSIFTGDDRVMPQLRLGGGAGMIGGMPNLFAADALRVFNAPAADATEPLRRAAARRIEVVDGNGGLVVIKAVLARRYQAPGWARAVPPLTALAPDALRDILAALEETGHAFGPEA